jgi:hypothetical protein
MQELQDAGPFGGVLGECSCDERLCIFTHCPWESRGCIADALLDLGSVSAGIVEGRAAATQEVQQAKPCVMCHVTCVM